MVQVWYLDEYLYGDPRLPHHMYPPRRICSDELLERTGIEYFKVNMLCGIGKSKKIAQLKREKRFTHDDLFVLDGRTAEDFRSKIEEIFVINTMPEEQARLVVEGSVYFDVIENESICWLRVLCEIGDLLIFPPNKFYRFTTTPQVRDQKLFK